MKKISFTQAQLQEWSFVLRRAANEINNSNLDAANHLYNVHYAIGPDVSPAEHDQFKLDAEYLAMEDSGGVAGLIASLKFVIANGEPLIDGDIWNGGLRDYLEQLLAHLARQ